MADENKENTNEQLKNNTQNNVQNDAQSNTQEDVFVFPAKNIPGTPKTPEQIAHAKTIANRYLGIQALEKILNRKKTKRQAKLYEKRFGTPETPEEYYDRAKRYETGAQIAENFLEQADYYRKAAEMFKGAEDYQDAQDKVNECNELAEKVTKEGYENAYIAAETLKNNATTADDWKIAARAFKKISGYRDADEQAEICESTMKNKVKWKKPKVIIAILCVILVILGAVRFSKTKRAKLYTAKIAQTVGLEGVALDLYEELGNYKGSNKVYQKIHYDLGVKRMEQEKYKSAISHFKECGRYEDAEDLLCECEYYRAFDFVDIKNYEKVVEHLKNSNGYKDADEIVVGYELALIKQADDGDRLHYGKSEYIILCKDDKKAFLLSKKLYGDTVYKAENIEDFCWANSDMRAVLNSQDYLDMKFNQYEQEQILTTTTSEGVEDKLFLLSSEEFLRYYSVMGSKDADWWLRNNGLYPGTAAFISNAGDLMQDGYSVNTYAIEGRAAFWVSLEEAE